MARINSPNFACVLKLNSRKSEFLGIRDCLHSGDFDPITCNQLIRHIIECRQNVRVKYMYNKQTRAAENSLIVDPGGGGTPIFGLNGYVPLNSVWFSGSCVLNRVHNFTIKRLEQDVFLDWKP